MFKLPINFINKDRYSFLHKIEKMMQSHQLIFLDYPIDSTPRYGNGKPPHDKLYNIINVNREKYEKIIKSFLDFKEFFLDIPKKAQDNTGEPSWINDSLPGLDSVTIYSLLCQKNPQRYFEIGSGFSTRFAKKAILSHGLQTKITSIDPQPRTEIDSLCDNIIRQPLEDIDLKIFDELENDDILFIDGSHYCFMNSDVTVVFLDILPRLKPGVLVEFHDITLPYDYPALWKERYFSEQYLLAVYILAESNKFDIYLPNNFISVDQKLSSILRPIWDSPKMNGVERHGGSFWIKMK